ncbi:MAG: sulfatase family protein, partial [bacterium]
RLTFVTGELGELYDLEQDPDEFDNLWSDPRYEKEKNKLIAVLLSHIAATRDPLPIRTKPY